ncbi:MAG: FkbM family methyltransferase [Nitrospiraceae bacterium]
MEVLESVVRKGDSVADIGANVGVYTRELSSLVGPDGCVYAFEPMTENYEILEAVIRKARLSNVFPFRAALGGRLGQSTMVIPDMGGFMGYYWAHIAQPGDSGQQETVEVLTLEELCRRKTIQCLHFIKCDVEGSELDVIQGGRTLIQSQLPGWLLEVARKTSDEVFNLLKGLGYRAYVYDKRLTPTESYRDKEFSNYFFFHPNSTVWDRVLPLIEH